MNKEWTYLFSVVCPWSIFVLWGIWLDCSSTEIVWTSSFFCKYLVVRIYLLLLCQWRAKLQYTIPNVFIWFIIPIATFILPYLSFRKKHLLCTQGHAWCVTKWGQRFSLEWFNKDSDNYQTIKWENCGVDKSETPNSTVRSKSRIFVITWPQVTFSMSMIFHDI